jgi:hypothetical protein
MPRMLPVPSLLGGCDATCCTCFSNGWLYLSFPSRSIDRLRHLLHFILWCSIPNPLLLYVYILYSTCLIPSSHICPPYAVFSLYINPHPFLCISFLSLLIVFHATVLFCSSTFCQIKIDLLFEPNINRLAKHCQSPPFAPQTHTWLTPSSFVLLIYRLALYWLGTPCLHPKRR